MKYLRRIFEEVNRDEYEQLKDFCEMYLAYLLDDGDWHIDITMRTSVYPNTGYYDCMIWRRLETQADGSHSYPNSTWDDISDRFIPFFKVLTDNYELVPTQYWYAVPATNGLPSSVSRSIRDGSLVNNLVDFSGANVPKERILGDLIPGNQSARKISFKVKRKI
jgi:hypothetical protein